jgi:photosystem II stability/assembly factor-like uncharacterized protein
MVQALPVPEGIVASSIACWSSTACEMTGFNGAYVSDMLGTRDGGRTWSPQSLPPAVGLLGAITCPAANRCVAVGSNLPGGALAVVYR